MGIRYEQHSDLCGCERCARAWDSENPYPVYDRIEDPEIMDCGCSYWRGCDCGGWTEEDEAALEEYEERKRQRIAEQNEY